MITKTIFTLVAIFILSCNIVVAKTMTANEMIEDFINDQCTVGKYFANLFYLPAWILKLFRALVVKIIK